MNAVVGLGSHQLLSTLREHDVGTYEHCLSVGRYAEQIARAMGLESSRVQEIAEVGRLHDVGKIAVPRQLLCGMGRLTAQDARIMRDHAAVGGLLVGSDDRVSHLERYVRAHHERLDGNGYPDGLKGEAIPLQSRVVAVADTFDALTAGRPYRRSVSVTDTLTILTATRGKQWDPDIVAVFVGLIERQGAVPRAQPETMPS